MVLPLAIASTILKYRRGSSVVREQLKWFAAVALLTVAGFIVRATGVAPIADVGGLLGILGLVLLPIAIGIAILRYRLYDIDRIISRTVSYAVVTGILAVVFVGTILVSQTFLASFLNGSSVAVAASTLVVAALFQPLRRRVQSVVDRRFDRSRYDAERTVAAFAGRLRDEVELERLEADIRSVVSLTLAPTSVGLWMRPEDPRSDEISRGQDFVTVPGRQRSRTRPPPDYVGHPRGRRCGLIPSPGRTCDEPWPRTG